MSKTTTKYIVHYKGYRGFSSHTNTFTKLENAHNYLLTCRTCFTHNFKENGMMWSDGSATITDNDLQQMLRDYFYIEREVTTSDRLDY